MKRQRATLRRAVTTALILVLGAPALSSADPGDLDASFGTGGVTLTDFGFADAAVTQDIADAVAVDGVGRVVVAGTSNSAFGNGLAVARFDTDGSLDATFGHDGRAVIRPGSCVGCGNGGGAVGLAIDGSGRAVIFTENQNAIFGVRLLDDGSLDPAFGTDGLVSILVGQSAWARDVAIDASGRIVLLGGTYNYSTFEFDTIVVRLSAAGALDATFGVGGVATLDQGPSDFAYGLGVDSAGIYVAGGLNNDFFLARFTHGGALDLSFGVGGQATADLGGTQEVAFALAIDGSGRIVIGGTTLTPGADLGLARFDASGDLDPTFDGDGMVITDAGPSPGYAEGVRALAIDAAGRIVASGWSHPGATYDTIAVRWLDDGSLDGSFAGDGIAELGSVADEDRAEAVATDGNDVLVAGYDFSSSADFKVVRLDSAGLLDASWNGTGIALTDLGPGHSRTETMYDIAELPDGRYVTAGGSAYDNTNSDTAIALYDADGSLDTSFGGDGRVLIDLGDWDEAYGVAVQPGLGILAAGYVDDELFVVRVGFDGGLDPTFGIGGVVRMAMGSFAYAWEMGVDAAGRIVLAGEGSGAARLIRLLADGTLDPAFGSGGHAIVSGSGYAASIAFDSADRIVTAIAGAPDIMVQRFTDAGAPDPTFGVGGVAQIVGPDYDQAMEATVDAFDRVVVVGSRASVRVLVARFDAAGNPDPTFDGDGLLLLQQVGTNVDRAEGLAIQDDGAIVFAGLTAGPDPGNVLVGRLLDDGSLDTTFAGDGVTTEDTGATDQAWGVLLDGAGRIVVVGSGGLNADGAIVRYEGNVTDDTAAGTATPATGGSASTGSDPSPSDPVETTVSVPAGTAGGPISITESQSPTIPPPAGYEALGLEVQITAPAASVTNPLELTFLFDKDAALAAGVDELSIQLLRNGVPVGDCTATNPISPNPCIVERSRTLDNDIKIRALTSDASAWSLALRQPFTFTGFLQPVDNQPVVNTMKAGSAVPIKFRLDGSQGLNVIVATYPRSTPIACGSTGPVDAIEQTSTAGSSVLTYDAASGTYTYTWKTEKAWASTCRQLVLRFSDGSYQRATFKFTK